MISQKFASPFTMQNAPPLPVNAVVPSGEIREPNSASNEEEGASYKLSGKTNPKLQIAKEDTACVAEKQCDARAENSLPSIGNFPSSKSLNVVSQLEACRSSNLSSVKTLKRLDNQAATLNQNKQ